MNEQAQKRFLDARQHFTATKDAWYRLGGQIRTFSDAFTPQERAQYGGGGWNQMVVAGQTVSVRPRVTTGTTGRVFDPSSWPTGEKIVNAWIEVNQAYGDLEVAFRALGADDRSYLAAQMPEP